jgi:two-component system sporulation sensor kinase A
MLKPVTNPAVKNFLLKNQIMAANLLIGGLLSVSLFLAYLQSHQNVYFSLLEVLLASEGLGVSLFLTVKLLKTIRIENALKEEDERLKLFTGIMEEAILIREGETIVEVNDVLARLLGYEISEMVGQKVFKFMDAEYSPKSIDWVAKGFPQDRFELLAKRKDGTTVPLLVRGRNIVYKGRPMRLSCGWDFTEYKKMQETIQLSEERFKSFAEVTREGILIHDQGTVVDVNQALADMVGMTVSDFIGRDSLFFVDEKSAKAIEDFRAGRVPAIPYEINLVHSNGTIIPSETQATDISWHGKNMRAVRIWNVAERKKMEKELEESRERFKSFAEVTKEGILVHDKGNLLDINQALLDMLGYKASEVLGRDTMLFMDEESVRKIAKYRSEGYVKEPYELSLRRADGTFIPVEAHGVPFTWGGRNLRVVRIWNLTERKKFEKELVESQERFRRFTEVAKEGILIHYLGTIVDANPAIAEMLGYQTAELVSKSMFDICDEETRKNSLKFQDEGYPDAPREVTLQRKDGSTFLAEIHGAGFKYDGKDMRVVSMWDITNRKKMEEALVESQERFKRFSEVSKEGIVIHENGVVVDVNQAGADLIGFPPSILIGQKLTDFAAEESRGKIVEYIQGGKFAKAEEMNIVRSDKTILPVEVTGAPLNLKGRNLRITNFWDLTARKRIEEALRKSEDSFRNLIERSPDAIIIHTLDKTVYVNEAMLNLLGYSKAGELVGTFPTFFVHPDDIDVVHRRINSLKVPGDYNPPQEKRFVRKDGVVIFVDVVSFMIYFEGVSMTVAVARDLTERKKVEEALRQSEKNFRHLIEKSPDGVLIHNLDEEPKIVYVNDAMLQFVGYTSEELIGKNADFFVHSKYVPGVKERIAKMKAQGDYNPPQEKNFVRKNGEIVCAEAVSFLIHYEGVPMAAVVARDLTERKKAEEALMKFERLSTIGEMAAGMAHEIRNPLAAISTAAQILQRKKIKENTGQLETILEQSDRLEKLVRDTLDYAKTGTGPTRQEFSIQAALESALNLSQIQFGPSHKKVKVVWDLQKEEVRIEADLGRIQQILVNLILNAFQIMSGEGELKLGLKRNKDFILIRVEDNGPGITDVNMKRIFEPFFTTKDYGSGLGLAISQRIAQEHGGFITVERIVPKGTAFTLEIPFVGEKQ